MRQFIQRSLTLMNRMPFAKVSPVASNIVKTHTPKTEYPGYKPIIRENFQNKVEVIEDPRTKLRFLVEQAGFPGCTDLGICVQLGTRDEQENTAGSLFYLKNFVHIKQTLEQITKYYDFYQQSGSFFNIEYDHSFTYIKCSFFSEDVDLMLDMLLDLALKQKRMLEENQVMESPVDNIVDLVRMTAFQHVGLGMPKSGVGNQLTSKDFINFQKKITPANTIFSVSNYPGKEKLIKMIAEKIEKKYPEFLRRQHTLRQKSVYKGGLQSYVNQNAEFFEFAIAYESCALNHPNMEMMNILRVILGSASAFSSGGPGKGMHSRCTKNLLNAVQCVEKTSFINEHYSDSGLFGLTVGGSMEQAHNVVSCTLKQFKQLLLPIQEEELERAKNILSASIYANIQRQADRLQEMSKHIFSYGRVRLMEYEEQIRKVTSSQINDYLRKMVEGRPTLVSLGTEDMRGRLAEWTKGQLP